MPRILGFDEQMLIQMLFQLVNTFLLCGGLTYLLYKPVKDFLRKRTERIKGELVAAEAAMKESNKLKAMYEKKLKEIEAERTECLEKAREQALSKEASIIAAAQKEAETIRQRAKLDIELEQQKIREEIKREIIDVSAIIASKFVTANMDEATQNAMLDNVISELGDAKWLN